MAENFNIGDVVRLKSGGPLMTVTDLTHFNGVTTATCTWFVDNKPEIGHFPFSALGRE